MNLIEQAKVLISKGEINETSLDLTLDILGAVMGDPISIGKIIITLSLSPFFWREQLFWSKMEAFVCGVYLEEEDRAKLCAKICCDGEYGDNSYRLITCIERAESKRKIRYLINVTRCLLTDFIDLPMYFRICHAITYTLEEDLIYLSEHIGESDLPYSSFVQGLLTSGLMYQSVIDAKGQQKYSFTPLAGYVDRYSVSYDDVERYPNPVRNDMVISDPTPKLPGISDWETLVEAELEKLY